MEERVGFFAEKCNSISEASIKPEGDSSGVSLSPLYHTLCTGATQRAGMCNVGIELIVANPGRRRDHADEHHA
jgi:hypothetical protein